MIILTVVVSIPIVVEAEWCGAIACSNGKGQCEKVEGNGGTCVHSKKQF